MNKKVKKIFQSNEPYIFLIIILLGIVVQIRSGQFFTANNIVDLLSAMIVPGLFAIAEFMALIAGGIDVSFPAIACASLYIPICVFKENDIDNVVLAFVFAAAIAALCSGVKAAMKKLLKGGQKHDDQQTAHRRGS